MNRFFKYCIAVLCCIAIAAACIGCMPEDTKKADASVPVIPEKLDVNADGVPVLKVYNTANDEIEEMDVESYLMGVVAGEMKNSWPLEALKAQAILARTFTMKFVSSKESSYENADISTDVHEAQAYDSKQINEQILKAVNDTRGLVMTSDGEYAHAWFHAHAGGKTELPTKALEYSEDPSYLSVVDSRESDQAPEDVKNWSAEFSLEEIETACKKVGVETGKIESFEIGERGESGRAVSFKANGKDVSAPELRIQLGASKLKSTLIHSIERTENAIIFTGSGFGHGVGMSQWGAHRMAEEGMDAEQIIRHYYSGVELVELW